jgi:hypothetical protein
MGRFSQGEKEFVEKNYSSMTIAELSLHLKRPKNSVRNYIATHGLEYKKVSRGISEDKMESFCACYPFTPNYEIAKTFDVSESYVQKLGTSLGMKKDSEHIVRIIRETCKLRRETKLYAVMLCWSCRGATNPADHPCIWAEKHRIPKGAKLKRIKINTEGKDITLRTFIVGCPNYKEG